MLIRLNKYISEAGLCSRREADNRISDGQIFVNNHKAVLGQKIDPDIDKVFFDRKLVKKENILSYYAFYKPKGVVSTTEDPEKRSKILDFLPKGQRIYPVGRLDKESEGLMVLTNDGELTYLLTHPKYEHKKEYEVLAANQKNKVFDQEKIKNNFEKGVLIDGILMKADKIYNFEIREDRVAFNIILHTGYHRQIRRMCGMFGLTVMNLKRIKLGKLSLSELKIASGKYINVKKSDII